MWCHLHIWGYWYFSQKSDWRREWQTTSVFLPWEPHEQYKEGWALKNWIFWTVVLEKTLETPLDCEEIQPIYPKGNQSWIFVGRTDGEAEAPTFWPPDAKNWIIGKDSDAGKDRKQEEKGMRENEMVGWYHWPSGHEFGQTLGSSEGQESLMCCCPWGRKESDMTEWLKNNNKNNYVLGSAPETRNTLMSKSNMGRF